MSTLFPLHFVCTLHLCVGAHPHPTQALTASVFEMGAAAPEKTLPDIRLAEQELDILFCPVAGGESLQEHHYFLEVHFQEAIRPFDQKGSADVKVKRGEAIIFGLWK